MKRKKLSLILKTILGVLFILSVANFTEPAYESFINSQKVDFYWISYQGFDSQGQCCPIILIEIDQFGNVVRQPKVVIGAKLLPLQSGGTAITAIGEDKLSLWAVRDRRIVLRAAIDKETLLTKAIKTTVLKTANADEIQVTQRKHKNFLTTFAESHGEAALTAFGISDDGSFNGTHWPISPSFFTDVECGRFSTCYGGVSSDAKTGFFVTDPPGPKTNLDLQTLGSRGRPNGDPTTVANARDLNPSGGIAAADITGTLDSGKKFVVYVDNRNYIEGLTGNLFLQVVDSMNKPSGPLIKLRKFSFFFGQSVAIDPLGRFVVFASDGGNGFSSGLSYQALDSTGHASGPVKLLDENGFTGIDILQE